VGWEKMEGRADRKIKREENRKRSRRNRGITKKFILHSTPYSILHTPYY
jgi:hypothetical protein